MNRDKYEQDRDWRRFDEQEDFTNRPGGLDRRWGYGNRLAPGRRGWDREVSEFDYPDEYNAPDYWMEGQDWMRPGPFTGVGPRNYRRSDEHILEDVSLRLNQHAQIDASDIEVSVKDGEVTLEGTVEDRKMKRMVEANVERVTGVIDVHNRLKLKKRDPKKEEEERRAREMADKFPGGPTPSGPAGH